MAQTSQRNPYLFHTKSLLAGIIVFALSITLSLHAIHTEQEQLENTLRDQVSQRAVDVSAHIQAEINADVFLANGLVAYIVAHPEDYAERINVALEALHKLSPHLRNVGIAPGNRISHVYPLKGNEGALGVYYPNIPAQWKAVSEAIKTHATILAGPVSLKQGGSGLISRTPVYLDNDEYWGIVSLVIDTQKLFDTSLQKIRENQIYFAIRGKDGKGNQGDIIYGDPGLFEQDSVKITTAIPGGTWQLAARPNDGWDSNQKHLIYAQFFAVFLSFLFGFVAYTLQNQRYRTAYSEERLRMFLENTHDGMIVIDNDGLIQEFNPAAEDLFGYSKTEMINSDVETLFPSKFKNEKKWFQQDTKFRKFKNGRQIRVRHKLGHEFPIEITIAVAKVNERPHYIGVIRDITERLKMEAKLRDLANTDGLTGALNRRAFLDYAEKQFKLAQRNQHSMSVLMMDLDHFKNVNDTHGHDAGDKALIHTVKIIEKCLRETDTFGRFGGEEFIAILPETSPSQAIEVFERILQNIRESKVVINPEKTISLTMSIGVSGIQDNDKNIDATIQRADNALYDAKNSGRDRYMISN